MRVMDRRPSYDEGTGTDTDRYQYRYKCKWYASRRSLCSPQQSSTMDAAR